MSTTRQSFSYSCGRMFDSDLQRIIRDGAMRFGLDVEHQQVRGWIQHENYWTVRGDSAKVAAFIAEARRVFSELGMGD